MVYALADKYNIRDLKAFALLKFKAATAEHWAAHDFLDAAREAYLSTVEADRGLRNVIVTTFHKHMELFDTEEAQDVLKEVGMLAYDLLMYTHSTKGLGWSVSATWRQGVRIRRPR